jgi:hypothetical protein
MATAWVRQARRRAAAFDQAGDRHRFGDTRDEARQAYAQWFDAMPWDWFATFTLPMGGRESAAFIWRAHQRWSRVMHRVYGRQLRQVAALEYQRRGTAHLHNLVHGVRPPRELDVATAERFHAMGVWEKVAAGGFARIHAYEANGGAASYCAKYVSKDLEVRLIGPWPPYPRP